MGHFVKTIVAVIATSTVSFAHAGSAEDIAARVETFEAAFKSGDAAAVALHYTTDAALLAPDTARIDGRDAIQGLWQAYVDAGVVDLQLTTVDLEDLGNTANEIGTYTLTAPDGNGGMVQAGGKYIVVWKADDNGVWHLHWDIWNSTP
ncbi:YybH family protein [Pseudohalocynthiibacter aestuariivivens]|uniref:YybH family protein n=1 Tax=Pseudohalocynthiibacter aestuariivivens TaxID=1591409 RepID=A0ABV5JEE4_9RHOB|nr:DUF4440 domain-containing protein [Pseudohalocynthiibacter aestuariivivens]MBS9718889.1 DUF4440 domain-containing protein [Pseudohalocynthiibacter aestuariivivens]